ncbi:nuclear transport factor 2 family protein [uncultured Alistipes sp.]|uniref:nuclear transport factor 2 family protein n=1 Tax=uncultured Alistipes sp. TaxID=538949 RepID=UPI0025DEA9AC|nr:nuclear transport factor 2 family protein [uncultured Alistipes sp.]
MTPKEVLQKWIDTFNCGDAETISGYYAEDAVNHQVANEPVVGRAAIRRMFEDEFAVADMVCIPENIFQDGEWAMLEWRDPTGLRGCGFFHIKDDKIIFQRGYFDKLTMLRKFGLPLPTE